MGGGDILLAGSQLNLRRGRSMPGEDWLLAHPKGLLGESRGGGAKQPGAESFE